MGLLRFLLIGFAIYWGWRLFTRFLLPFLAKYFLKKATTKMQDQVKNQREGQKVYSSGNVEIRKTTQQKSGGTNNTQEEYVDFEEVE